MSGHVPHVRDGGQALTAQCGTCHRILGLHTIPQVDSIVMSGMHWIGIKHILQNRIHSYVADDRQSCSRVLPKLQAQEGFRFDVVRKFHNDIFQVFGVGLSAIFLTDRLVFVVFVTKRLCCSVDVHLLAPRRVVFLFHGSRDELTGSLSILYIRQRHPPITDCTIGVDRGCLPK